MSLAALPLFVKMSGRPVILLGEGEPAAAKRRLLDRAGAMVVGEEQQAALAIVAIDDQAQAEAAIARLKARGILVNAVDRPEHCDFTLPAIVDRSPVVVAIGTGGVAAGLAAALRQRLETLLPASVGALATALNTARPALRSRLPDGGDRRRAIGAALAEGGSLDALADASAAAVPRWAASSEAPADRIERLTLTSSDPDDLTLRQARLLAAADRLCHAADAPAAILDRARADAERIVGPAPAGARGLTIVLEMMR